MNRPISLSLLASRNFTIENQFIEAPASGIGNLSFQQLLQRLINPSPCENKVFSLKFLYVRVCNRDVMLMVR